ncbi:hypothetical protein [Sphingobacterium suaedae]|uniref:Prophage tail endopeptidase domain-containing protein n=1 Tax=Sphingobacterium suaedae TaxID=1686402 RepID=A0ABW5KHR7_9SPHI
MEIQVYRGNTAAAKLPLNLSTFTKVMMGEHSLVFSFVSPSKVDIRVGDTLTYKNELMIVNTDPTFVKNHLYQYDIRFEGHRHSLARWLIMDEGALTFDYFGDANDYIFMLLERLNQVDSGWTAGDVEVGLDPVPLSFDEIDCYSALNDIAQALGCEWDIVGKSISLKKTIGRATTLSFAYGKGNGLYELTRNIVDNSKIVTRAYASGGTENLPQGYTKKKFTLPGYLEDATALALYGLREGSINDPEIYPNRTATVTDIGQINEGTWTVTDSTIDFDLQGQFIAGTEPKIVFKSGALNAQDFKILGYNHDTKTIRYEAKKDSNGALTPVGLVRAEIGDYYTLVGIRMPETYVTAALTKLEEKRAEYLASNKDPRVIFDLNIDILNLKRLNTEPQAGDIVRVIDEENDIDAEVRVTQVSYPGHFPEVLEQGMQFTAEIGNEVTYTRVQKIEKDIKESKEIVTQVSRDSWERDRRNLVALNEFMGKIFDPDGKLTEPLIKAIVGFFGTESMIYDLDGVTYIVNEGGDENAFSITGGQLIHKTFEVSGLGEIWNLTGLSVTGLDPLKSYYLSAKCSRVALTGEWVLTEHQMPTEAEAGYWYFNLGVLSSVIEGSRSLQSTMGFTMISGGNIITDTITAYYINVKKLFAQLIEVGSNGYTNAGISGLTKESPNELKSVRFWAGSTGENRDSAPFRVLEDGSLSSTKGKIGGFAIDATTLRSESVDDGGSNPTNPSSGIILSDLGVLSRNSGMSFLPSSTGLDFSASLVGEASTQLPPSRPVFTAEVRAGIIGAVRQELTQQALDMLWGAWGRYGGMFTSLKLLGAVYESVRLDTGSGDSYMTAGDYYLAKGGTNNNVFLPSDGVERGRKVVIKNATGDALNVLGNGANIYLIGNTVASSAIISVGGTRAYRYSPGGEWLESTG